MRGCIDPARIFILTSSPRSGSTLLGQVLGVIPKSCILFEPLHQGHVPEAKIEGMTWRTYRDPNIKWPEGTLFFHNIFNGRVINHWTAKEMSLKDAIKAKVMIVKFVRANRLLPWICNTFDIPSPILLIRHPCAVVSSQLIAGWKNVKKPEIPSFLRDYPAFVEIIDNTKSPEEYLAAAWAMDQLPALLELRPHPWKIITYEQLILNPTPILSEIFDDWKVSVDMDLALSKFKKPSRVVSKSGISGISGWKSRLSEQQISRILSTVHAFGLDLYSFDDEPDYDLLFSEELPYILRRKGMGRCS